MDERKLNRKLAEELAGWDMKNWDNLRLFKRPDDIYGEDPEEFNFTQSLDACFKWLVPKIHEKYPDAIVEVWKYADRAKGLIWNMAEHVSEVDAETPALALCLALEKLIDDQPSRRKEER